MRRLRATTLLLLAASLALLLLPTTLASQYEVSIATINNSIAQDGAASYTLGIYNFESRGMRFQLYSVDPNWIIRIEPSLHIVDAKSKQEYRIELRPSVPLEFGTHATTVRIKNLDTEEILQKTLVVHMENPNRPPGAYLPSVQMNVRLPSGVAPGEPIQVDIGLVNRNSLNISETRIEISSPIFSKSISTDLPPLGERSSSFSVPIDRFQAPGEYPVIIKLLYENETINEASMGFLVESVTDVVETPVDESGIFWTRVTLQLRNDGNTFAPYQAKLPTTAFRAFFSRTSPDIARQRIGGQQYFVWDVPLAPQATAQVQRTEDYRILVILLVIALIGVVGYFALRSPLIAMKEAQPQPDNEGLSRLKVRIFLKNRTGKPVTGVEVHDRIPSLANYVRSDHLGIMTPTKVVVDEKKGTMVKWELDILEPYEERILTYTMASSLKIIGGIRLPQARVKFTGAQNRERVVYTKNVEVREERPKPKRNDIEYGLKEL